MHRGSLTASLAAFVGPEMERLQIPGLSIGVVHGDRTETWHYGITNVEFGLPVDDATLFLIGSTTKTFTATTLMVLAESGDLDLDAPVRNYLPTFRVPDEDAAARVRVRDLVSHHLGWKGDYFDQLGRGSDAVRRYVSRMRRQVPQITPFGETFAYNNAGFVVAGRIIEVVAGGHYEEIVAERLFAPLGLSDTYFFAEDVMTRKHALGHSYTTRGPEIVRPYTLDRSVHPAGGIASTVLDQLAWARFHLGTGKATDGSRVLSAKALRSMQRPVAKAGSMCDEVGFSWLMTQLADGTTMIGHGGTIAGQMSAFQIVPKHDFAMACLTNGAKGHLLDTQIVDFLLDAVLGTGVTDPPRKPPADLAQYAALYRADPGVLQVSVDGDALVLAQHLPPSLAEDADRVAAKPAPVRLEFTGRDCGVPVGETSARRFEFLRGADGSIDFLRWGGRLLPRRDDLVPADSMSSSDASVHRSVRHAPR